MLFAPFLFLNHVYNNKHIRTALYVYFISDPHKPTTSQSIFLIMKRRNRQIQIEEMFTGDCLNDFAWEYMSELVRTVAYRYFSHEDIEDLISLALPDIASFAIKVRNNSESGFNKPSNLRNVLFTRTRNTMSNYMHKLNGRNRIKFISLESLDWFANKIRID